MAKYIKITAKDGSSAVVLDYLRPFFLSQGAKIAEATMEEIVEIFPEEKKEQGKKKRTK